MKKASKFAAWLSEAQRPPFVLLTDWREVKPCTEAAALQSPQNRPAFTVVLAEGPRQFERASAWAQGFSLNTDPVHVCRDIGLPKAFFSVLVRRLLTQGSPSLRLGLQHRHAELIEAAARPLPNCGERPRQQERGVSLEGAKEQLAVQNVRTVQQPAGRYGLGHHEQAGTEA